MREKFVIKQHKTYLLSIPGECYRLVVIVLKDNVSQLCVRDILNYVPLYWEEPIPLIKLPKVHVFAKINWPNHFSHAYKLPTSINLKFGKQKLGNAH